jgi:Zn-dependent peptidase ImmA (M78 family)
MDKGAPMKLSIFGKKVVVKKRRGLASVEGFDGLFFPANDLIVLDADLKGKQLNHVLIHEMIHCVINRTGILQAGLSEGLEEVLCENIATALVENFTLKKCYR